MLARPRARRLRSSFYDRPTLDVLADIIGKVLVHDVRGRRTSGVIVEAEAYVGETDPACHAAPGPTMRNAPLYGPPGRAYVYLNYGIHCLVNVVTEGSGAPAAILIRALEPLEGIDLMRQRRARAARAAGHGETARRETSALCRGPGNLTIALGIRLRHNRVSLVTGPLALEDHGIRARHLTWSPRVGLRVGVNRPWRCAWSGHPCVSGPRRSPTTAGEGPPSAVRPEHRR